MNKIAILFIGSNYIGYIQTMYDGLIFDFRHIMGKISRYLNDLVPEDKPINEFRTHLGMILK